MSFLFILGESIIYSQQGMKTDMPVNTTIESLENLQFYGKCR